jgi:hypothetical protein
MAACHVNAKGRVLRLRKGGGVRAPVSATSLLHLLFRISPRFQQCQQYAGPYFICLAAEDGIGMPVRWVSHASMPCLTYTLKHNQLTQFLVREFLCQSQACQHGTVRKRTLHMMYLCLSLAALGLVALAGCEVHNPSHFNTEAETMQVPSISELLFRPKCCCSRFFLRHSYRGVLLNC